MKTAAALSTGLMLMSTASAALDPIVIKGSKFFEKTSGKQFYMKGVAYQSEVPAGSSKSYIDPLADVESCKRDIPLLEELGTNTIRVYAVDPTANHDTCMKLLDDAGIYVVADLSEPKISINRDTPEWDETIYQRYTAVVDSLASYSNVIGFFAGNEVTNQPNNTAASAYVKAAIRDTKKYIKDKNYRTIPVGYATNDDAEIRYQLADYFNCGEAEDSTDFWGYNIYSWCGESTFKKSGFDVRTADFANYSVPVFFAEYGCNEVRPRPFTEVQVLYGKEMKDVWSGGIVYMYHEEANKYGLVKVSNGKATKLDDFDNLKKQISKVGDVEGVKMSEYTPTNTKARDCPAKQKAWTASSVLPPTPDKALCSCMLDSLECTSKRTLKDEDMGDLFSYICGEAGTDCSGITGDAEKGVYGAYSMCDPAERLAWAMNAYYESQSFATSACDFDGKAQLVTPNPASTCDAKIEDAGGLQGAPASSDGGSSSSGGSKSGSGSGSGSGAGMNTVPLVMASLAAVAGSLLFW